MGHESRDDPMKVEPSIADLLAMDEGVTIEFEPGRLRLKARTADLSITGLRK